MIVYNIDTGEIIGEIPDDVDPYVVYRKHQVAINNKIGTLIAPKRIRKISNYRVIDGKLVRYTEQELEEKRQYGRILTEEERLLEGLKPSPEEVRKAEQTIEILTLIQEVI